MSDTLADMEKRTRDQEIGGNVQRLRGDYSQKEIADCMRSEGWKWSQATVWAVEKGERPLKLAEAVSLAAYIADGNVMELLRVPLNYLFFDAQVQFERAQAELRGAGAGYDFALHALAVAADEWTAKDGGAVVEEELKGVDFALTAGEFLRVDRLAPRRGHWAGDLGKGGPHEREFFEGDDGT